MARYCCVVLTLIGLAPGARRDVLALRSHEHPRVIAATLRGGVACTQDRVHHRPPAAFRFKAPRWQTAFEPAQTAKFEKQPEHTLTAEHLSEHRNKNGLKRQVAANSVASTSTDDDADEGAAAGITAVPDSQPPDSADAWRLLLSCAKHCATQLGKLSQGTTSHLNWRLSWKLGDAVSCIVPTIKSARSVLPATH
jgi:hypothetical protein